ncbi:MAG: ChbG/HpnK family deacetylase [Hydrogenophilus sp.]|nr:ChbG/HpnK family deacetylase [Hydrogenophilus sp.]
MNEDHLPFQKRLVVCADDFGLAPGVNDAIVNLIDKGAVTATSVMSGQPFWREWAAALQAASKGKAEVGWHVTLTEQKPAFAGSPLAPMGRLPSLEWLLPRALAGTLPLKAVRDELEAQLEAFGTAWGRGPDFVDGHQHVHLLPGIREVVATVLEERMGEEGFWVRDGVDSWTAILRRGVGVPKALFLAQVGRGWRRLADGRGWPHNEGFAGVHDFGASVPFRAKFQRFLRAAGARHLIFVHPGFPDRTLAQVERVVEARRWEYDYLASPALAEDLAAAGVVLTCGWRERG